jgi:flagellar biosynthesis anti-sigma factor FlgM
MNCNSLVTQYLGDGLKLLPGNADSCTVETGEVAMKIDVNSPVLNQLTTDRGAKQVSNGSLSGAQGSTEDRTTFHSDSASVQALTSQAMQSPDVRQGKVDAISQSVKSGEYKADPTETAGAILDSEVE